MYNNKRFVFLLILSSLLLSILGIFAVNAMSDLNNESQSSIKFFQYQNNLGAGGYDVVAYFEDNAAVEGKNVYEANFAGVLWNFKSAENRDKFLATPDQYLPEYGGHCAYGVAQGYLVRGDPQAWSIRDNKLYLNYNKNIRNAWIADAQRFLRQSENNWPQLNK